MLKMIVPARSSRIKREATTRGTGDKLDPRDANEREKSRHLSRNTVGRLSVAGVRGIINP